MMDLGPLVHLGLGLLCNMSDSWFRLFALNPGLSIHSDVLVSMLQIAHIVGAIYSIRTHYQPGRTKASKD